jgi:hypothetical protein
MIKVGLVFLIFYFIINKSSQRRKSVRKKSTFFCKLTFKYKHDSLQIISTHCVLNFINILGYGPAPTGYGEEDSFPDLTPFLALSLVILGLSLLFPAIITITDINSPTDDTNGMVAMNGGRKRRYADEGNKKSINCA